jgi:hypothetical protein
MSGFSTSAITSIRNNKRKRLDKFERIERYIGTESAAAEYNEASEYVLHKIRNQVQEQQRQSRRKTIIIFSIVGVVLIATMCYFLFIHEFPDEVPMIFKFG